MANRATTTVKATGANYSEPPSAAPGGMAQNKSLNCSKLLGIYDYIHTLLTLLYNSIQTYAGHGTRPAHSIYIYHCVPDSARIKTLHSERRLDETEPQLCLVVKNTHDERTHKTAYFSGFLLVSYIDFHTHPPIEIETRQFPINRNRDLWSRPVFRCALQIRSLVCANFGR